MKRWWRRRSLRARLHAHRRRRAVRRLPRRRRRVWSRPSASCCSARSTPRRWRPARRWPPSSTPASLPQPLPVAGAEQVQVVDAAGRVRSASIDADRAGADAPPRTSWPGLGPASGCSSTATGSASGRSGPGGRGAGRTGRRPADGHRGTVHGGRAARPGRAAHPAVRRVSAAGRGAGPRRLAGDRRDPAPGGVAAARGRGDHRRRRPRRACRCRSGATRSTGWR